MQIKQIEKQIQQGEHQIREHQQFWIMLQNHYVNLTHKRSDQLLENQVTRKREYYHLYTYIVVYLYTYIFVEMINNKFFHIFRTFNHKAEIAKS